MREQDWTRFWQFFGRRECEVVLKFDEWSASLPSGYAYDPTLDGIYHTNGARLDDPSPYWQTTAVAYFPITGSSLSHTDFVGGYVEDGKTRICVLYENLLPFFECFAVIVGDRLCKVEAYDDTTPGIANIVLVDR